MALPTVADVTKAKANLDAHDAVINGDENTTETMPDGGQVDTLAKAIASIKAFTDRGTWAQNTAYAVKDLVSDPDESESTEVYVRVTGGTSPASGSFQDEYNGGAGPWRVYGGVLYPALFFETGVVDTQYKYNDFRRYGVVGDGSEDDTTAVDNAFASGSVFSLTGSLSVKITSRIDIPASTHITGDKTSEFYMPAASFANGTKGYGTDQIGLYSNGNDNIWLSGFKIRKEVAESSRALGIAIRDGDNVMIEGIEASGFALADGIISVDSLINFQIRDCYIHDCTQAANPGTSENLTGINVDDSKVGSVPSIGSIHHNVIKNLTVSGAFLTAYGYQTDGINVQIGSQVDVHNNDIDTVGEGIDFFGDNSKIHDNTVKNAYIYGIKLIHGASYNDVHDNTIIDAGLAGIVVSGTSTAAKATNHNTFHHNKVIGIDPNDNWSASTRGCMSVIGGTETYKATNNKFNFNEFIVTGTSNVEYHIVDIQSGNTGNNELNNYFYGTASAGIVNTGSQVSPVSDARKSSVNAYINATQTGVATATETPITYTAEIYDQRGEWSTSTHDFTADAPCIVDITAAYRCGTATSGNTWKIRIYINSTVVAEHAAVVPATNEISDSISTRQKLNQGDVVDARVLHTDGSDRSLTAGRQFGYFALSQAN